MYRKYTGILIAVTLAIMMVGSLCVGCSSQDSSSQSPSQTAGNMQQPPEGMEPPADGERPEGMTQGMGGGFNMTDDEFQELLDTAVADGTITEQEAAEIEEWWQQRPEFDSEEMDEAQMEEMNEWMQQQPECAMGIFGGMRGPGGGGPPPDGGGQPPQQ